MDWNGGDRYDAQVRRRCRECEGECMAHKFRVGDFVDFRPIGAKVAGLFKIIMRMPVEFGASGWQYRIKSDQEGFSRTVYEWDLSPSIIPEESYEPLQTTKRAGRG